MIWSTRRKLSATALVLVGLLVAVCMPLLTYTLSLALFGLAHVVAELHYVDARFGSRLATRLRIGFLVFLGAIVVNRSLTALGLGFLPSVELMLVAGLSALVLPDCFRAGALPAILAVTTLAILFIGIGAQPAHTLLLFSIAHNFTPVGFLSERLKGKERTVALSLCAVVFGLIPGLIATGAVPWVMERSIGIHQDLSWFSGDNLKKYMNVYVPSAWIESPFALHAFSAAVFTQCMHYAVVIGVLPGLIDASTDKPLVPWPKQALFRRGVWIGGAVVFVMFCLSFNDARLFYAIPAAVHAWIEIPLLLLAAAGINSQKGAIR